jgi:hypothetical protein
MKTFTILLLLTIATIPLAVGGCYSKGDAKKDISESGGPNPINCVVEGGGKYAATVIDCIDGIGDEWKCTRGDGCVNFGRIGGRR